jgi:hypothetical protein
MDLSSIAAVIDAVAKQDAVTGPPSVSIALDAVSRHEAERIAESLLVLFGGELREHATAKYPHYAIAAGRDFISVHFPSEPGGEAA